jgi:hypothetical protein
MKQIHPIELFSCSSFIIFISFHCDGWVARQSATRRNAACAAPTTSSPSASNRCDTAWRPARGIKQENRTRPPGSPSTVNRVTPKVCILRSRTAQSSPLTAAEFGATGEEDDDKDGEEELVDDGGFDGNKSASVSRMAGGIFRSNDEGEDDGTGAGSRAGSGADTAMAGVRLGSKGAAWREGDASGAASEVVEGVIVDGDDDGRDPGDPLSRPDLGLDFGRGLETGRSDATCSEDSPSAISEGTGANGPRILSPSDLAGLAGADPSETVSGLGVASRSIEAISPPSLKPRERSTRVWAQLKAGPFTNAPPKNEAEISTATRMA